MTAILASDQPHHDRAEQLKQLRRQMAAVSGKVGSHRRGHVHIPATADELLPDSETRLPVPQLLADVLPDALPRGTVAVLSGGPVAAAEHGGHRDGRGRERGHCRPAGYRPAGRRGNGSRSEPACRHPGSRCRPGGGCCGAHGRDGSDRAGSGRALGATDPRPGRGGPCSSERGCTLLVTDGDWQGASLRLKARVCGYETTADIPGFGRISKVRLEVCAVGRAIRRARTG